MKPIIALFALLALLALTTTASAKPAGAYARVNGVTMYYEIHGKASPGTRPVVLVHGAFCTIDACFAKLLPVLAEKRQVIALELQGHGHTADIDRPMTIEQLTEDTAALMKTLKLEDADIVGFSIGAGIAVRLAIAHPELTHKIALISPVLNNAGFHPGLAEGIQQITPELMKQTPFYTAWAAVAPKKEQWAGFVKHIVQMNASYRDLPAAAVKGITAPAMIVVGDSDIMRPEHVAEMFRLFGGGVMGDSPAGLGNARLAVLPATSHLTVAIHPQTGPFIAAFLDAPIK